MLCPKCHHDTTVVESRFWASDHSIRRRRRCTECGHLVRTCEVVADVQITLPKEERVKVRKAKKRATTEEQRQVQNMRSAAYKEHYATGRPIEEIYAQWGLKRGKPRKKSDAVAPPAVA